MKNIKKIVAVLLSMTAIASTSVMAADEANFKSGTASLELKETVLSGEQLTVVIVPTTATEITSENIYYINQGAIGEEFTNILKAMKVKDGYEKDYKEYEVRIGGVVEGDKYVVKTFKFKADEPTIMYGDADGNKAIANADAVKIFQYVAAEDKTAIVINSANADADGNGAIANADAVRIFQYVAAENKDDVILGPAK